MQISELFPALWYAFFRSPKFLAFKKTFFVENPFAGRDDFVILTLQECQRLNQCWTSLRLKLTLLRKYSLQLFNVGLNGKLPTVGRVIGSIGIVFNLRIKSLIDHKWEKLPLFKRSLAFQKLFFSFDNGLNSSISTQSVGFKNIKIKNLIK